MKKWEDVAEVGAVSGKMAFSTVGASFISANGLSPLFPTLWGFSFASKSRPSEVLTKRELLVS